jgi:hypothetical protein
MIADVLALSRVALVFLVPGAFVGRNCYSHAENNKTLRHCLYHWYGPGPNCLARRENHAQESEQQQISTIGPSLSGIANARANFFV